MFSTNQSVAPQTSTLQNKSHQHYGDIFGAPAVENTGLAGPVGGVSRSTTAELMNLPSGPDLFRKESQKFHHQIKDPLKYFDNQFLGGKA